MNHPLLGWLAALGVFWALVVLLLTGCAGDEGTLAVRAGQLLQAIGHLP